MPDFSNQVQAFFQSTTTARKSEPTPISQNIAFVCTGNICRSAFAHHALELELQQRLDSQPFGVTSAGLRALIGSPMESQMAAEFQRLYSTAPIHRAQQIDDTFVANADLLLVMTRDHRREVLYWYPQSAQKCFLLSEFLSILASTRLSSSQLGFTQLISYAHSHRAIAHNSFSDIDDPFRRSPETHQTVANQLALAVRKLGKLFISDPKQSAR